MRVVFMGTPAFAATCLSRISTGEFEIVGVYTKIDTPKNRGMKLAISEVKAEALEKGYPIYQPLTFKDDAVYEELKALRPDVIVAVAYGKILPQRVLDIPKLGCINIHGSILPALRGAAPVQWAVLNGLEETGVTAMYMSAGMDEGDIIEIRKTSVDPSETAGDLMDRLALIGADLLYDTLKLVESLGLLPAAHQDPMLATYAPMLTKELSPIDWGKTARQIVCQIHGLDPWPAATAELGGTHFKIFGAECSDIQSDFAPGTPIELNKKGLLVACKEGSVLVTELQADGGKRMRAPDYFRGHPISL